MKQLLDAIQGHKTQAISTAATLLTLAQTFGLVHIDPAKMQAALTLLGAGAAVTLHDAVKRAAKG